MALLYVVCLSLFATVLTCDLTSTDAEIAEKASLEEYIANKLESIDPTYRLLYHVAPPVGWMNDPNGFSFFKGKYHLFYQFYPYDSQWGPMHWGHVESTNLVDWTQLPTALLPDSVQNIYSGSAIEKDGTLVLMYTGHENLPDQNPGHKEYQNLAFSNDGVVFNKYVNNPVIPTAYNGSAEFRDPKVWKYGDYWYVVIGSQTADILGTVLLYRSSDMGTWEYLNSLGESSSEMGYMWECPDFFQLNGKYILLMSPQGINATGDRYKNLYQTGYIIGTFDYETHRFVEEKKFQEIDYGHDFYATQTTQKDGKTYLIAWFGMWESEFPEAAHGWAGAMTIFRELTLWNETRILMKPVDAITDLRVLPAIFNTALAPNGIIDTLNKTGELIVSGDLTQEINLEITGSDGGGKITLRWDPSTSNVEVNRNDDIRRGPWTPVSSTSWRIFLDSSSMELFCGEGEVVFSSRVYPNGSWKVTNVGTQDLQVEAYTLRRSVPA